MNTYLPLDTVNDAGKLIYQARGIVQMIRQGGNNVETSDCIPGACWAVEDMLERLEGIVNARPST